MPSSIKNQVPRSWGAGKRTRNGKGWFWNNPSNKNNKIRFMSGNPSSDFRSQRKPYVVQTINNNGQRLYLDQNGNPGTKESSATHINYNLFKNKQ